MHDAEAEDFEAIAIFRWSWLTWAARRYFVSAA
jgi:hypothetical protein